MSQRDEPRDDEAAPPDGQSRPAPSAADRGAPARGPEPAKAPRGALFIAACALILALGAAAATGFVWLQYRALEARDGTAGQALERVHARLGRIEDELGTAAARLDADARARQALEHRLDELPGRFDELERRVDALAGGTAAARERWLRAEAEHYLSVASTQLQLADDWDNAITALELADTRLREIGDPRFAPVRELIADERLALEGVEQPDVDGIAFSLSGLAERAAAMPLRGEAPASTAAPEAAPDVEPGFGRLLGGLENALSSLVRIERRDEPVAPALSATEQRLLRRQVALNLELAGIALVSRETQLYRRSLDTARALLEREFDPRSRAVSGAVDRLATLAGIEIAPPKPDIGGSLARLRAVPAGGE